MQELRWKDRNSAAVHLLALADFQGIPQSALLHPDESLKTPSQLLEEGVLPEAVWRPYVR